MTPSVGQAAAARRRGRGRQVGAGDETEGSRCPRPGDTAQPSGPSPLPAMNTVSRHKLFDSQCHVTNCLIHSVTS